MILGILLISPMVSAKIISGEVTEVVQSYRGTPYPNYLRTWIITDLDEDSLLQGKCLKITSGEYKNENYHISYFGHAYRMPNPNSDYILFANNIYLPNLEIGTTFKIKDKSCYLI